MYLMNKLGGMSMKLNVSSEVLGDLKKSLASRNKSAVRVVLEGFG
jgi:hypothetical protein